MLLDLDAQHKGDAIESFLSGSKTEGLNEGKSKYATICKLALYYLFMLFIKTSVACKLEYK